MAGNIIVKAKHIFHEDVTAPGNGEVCPIISNASTLNIDFMGTGTFLAIIEGKVLEESEFDEIMSINTKTSDLSDIVPVSTFDTYQVDVVGWSYVQVRLVNVSGEITALGRLVG